MRRAAVALLAVLATACVKLPVAEQVTLDLEPGGLAVVTAVTELETHPKSQAVQRRVDEARGAALAGTDGWAPRFARLSAELERVTLERRRGVLQQVTRTARIPRSDIQRFFADASLTVSLLDGDGWSELSIYPGTSSRASREQRERFSRRMAAWSGEVARYFTAVHDLYSYLETHPQRARPVFAGLFDERRAAFTESEEPLVEEVTAAMETIAARLDVTEGEAYAFAEEADLVFNPFPAHLVIRLPGEVLDARGFQLKGRDAIAERVDIFAAIASMEGEWISPDPLAILLRDDEATRIEDIVAMPRKSTGMVTAQAIEAALRDRMTRSSPYTVRWRE